MVADSIFWAILTLLYVASATAVTALPMNDDGRLSPHEATRLALIYAYPLVAFQTKYNALAPLIGINNLGHARQLSTSQARSTVKPNADTVYSTALYDVSQHDLFIQIPAIPEDQYALFSFHDSYGNNFAIIGQENLTDSGKFILTHEAATPRSDKAHGKRIISPTTFGTLLVRWLLRDGNLETIHSLQNASTMSPVPVRSQTQTDGRQDHPMLASIDWNKSAQTPAHNALRLLCQVRAVNTPGFLASATVQEVLQTSGFCMHNSTSSEVDIDEVNRNVLVELKAAGQASLEKRNNGWSVIQNKLAGYFGGNYGLRAQIAFTGYLMLQAPTALYPSWSSNSSGLPLEGEILDLGPSESYIYTFSSKPPLGELGFWSLTAYDVDGFPIKNSRNISSLGDRSNITYPSGKMVYDPASLVECDGVFQLLVQPADVSPPANWTGNWLPGPSGGGRMTVLLRFYNAAKDLLDGQYQFPTVSKQECIVDGSSSAERQLVKLGV